MIDVIVYLVIVLASFIGGYFIGYVAFMLWGEGHR